MSKKFIIIGNKNAITYKEIFPLIKDNKLWLGVCVPADFIQPDDVEKKTLAGLTRWFTNIEHQKRNTPLSLYKKYNSIEYHKYDNYDAVEVSKVESIPMDYDGVMGIPITFLDKYCPEQFEIVGIACGNSWANFRETLMKLNFNPNIKYGGGLGSGVINGKGVYSRILIRKKL